MHLHKQRFLENVSKNGSDVWNFMTTSEKGGKTNHSNQSRKR